MQKYLKIFNISQLLERLPCVSGAKREEGGGGEGKKAKGKMEGERRPFCSLPNPLPFPRSSPFHFDAHYAG